MQSKELAVVQGISVAERTKLRIYALLIRKFSIFCLHHYNSLENEFVLCRIVLKTKKEVTILILLCPPLCT